MMTVLEQALKQQPELPRAVTTSSACGNSSDDPLQSHRFLFTFIPLPPLLHCTHYITHFFLLHELLYRLPNYSHSMPNSPSLKMSVNTGPAVLHSVSAAVMAWGYRELERTVTNQWITEQVGGHFQFLTIQGSVVN